MAIPARDFSTKDGLSSVELGHLANQLGGALRSEFKGVFSKDEIPQLHGQECMIINIQNDRDGNGARLPGTHWVAAGIQHDHAWYFDSFGLAVPVNIASHLPHPISHSSHQVQDPNSNLCGLFALGACDAVTMHPQRLPMESLSHYVEIFDAPTLNDNDAKLHAYFTNRKSLHHTGITDPRQLK